MLGSSLISLLLHSLLFHLLLFSYKVMSDSCDPMVCSPSDSSVHGISQAILLEWVAIPFSRGSSQPGIEPGSPTLAGGFFTTDVGSPLLFYLGTILCNHSYESSSSLTCTLPLVHCWQSSCPFISLDKGTPGTRTETLPL